MSKTRTTRWRRHGGLRLACATAAALLLSASGAVTFSTTWAGWIAAAFFIVGVGALVAAVLPADAPAPQARRRPSGQRPWWVDDDDVDVADDEFGRQDFVNNTVRIFHDVAREPESLVVGLVGPWGDGKSTTVRWLQRRLEEEDWEVVRMGAWAASGADAVTLELLRVLNRSLSSTARTRQRALFRQIRRSALPVLEAAVPAAEAVPVVGPVIAKIGVSALLPSATGEPLQEQIKELKRIAQDSARPTLVVVDDLDRLQLDELEALLKAVRVLGRLPTVHYLLVYDEAKLVQLLDRAARDDATDRRVEDRRAVGLLEKVVTLPLQHPPATRDDVERLLRQRLGALVVNGQAPAAQEVEDRLDVEVDAFFVELITTPRDVIRFIAQLHSLLPLLGDRSVDALDFAVLTLLRLRYRRLYDALTLDREALVTTDLSAGEVVRSRWRSGEPVRSTDVPAVEQGAVQDALRRLFPQSIGSAPGPESDVRRATYQAWPRVSDHDCVDTYFTFADHSSDDEVLAQSVADELASGTMGSALERLHEVLAETTPLPAAAPDSTLRRSAAVRAVRLLRRTAALSRASGRPTEVHVRAVLGLFPLPPGASGPTDPQRAALTWLGSVLSEQTLPALLAVAVIDASSTPDERAAPLLAVAHAVREGLVVRDDLDDLREAIAGCGWRLVVDAAASEWGPDVPTREVLQATDAVAPHRLDLRVLDSQAQRPPSITPVALAACWAREEVESDDDGVTQVLRIAGPAEVQRSLSQWPYDAGGSASWQSLRTLVAAQLVSALGDDLPAPLPRGVDDVVDGPVVDTPSPLARLNVGAGDLALSFSAFIASEHPPSPSTASPRTWAEMTRSLLHDDPLWRRMNQMAPAWGASLDGWKVEENETELRTAALDFSSQTDGQGVSRRTHPIRAAVQVSRSGPLGGQHGLHVVYECSWQLSTLDAERRRTNIVQRGTPLPAAFSPVEVADLVEATLGSLLEALSTTAVLLSPVEQVAPMRLRLQSIGHTSLRQVTKLPPDVLWREGAASRQLDAAWSLERSALPAVQRQVSRLSDRLLREWLARDGVQDPGVVDWRSAP